MRRLLVSLMLAVLLMLFTAAVAFAQPPLPVPPTEKEACKFVGDQGAPIGDDCDVEPAPYP